MKSYRELSKEELLALQAELQAEYDAEKAKGLNLDISRGKPGKEQLDLSMPMMDVLSISPLHFLLFSVFCFHFFARFSLTLSFFLKTFRVYLINRIVFHNEIFIHNPFSPLIRWNNYRYFYLYITIYENFTGSFPVLRRFLCQIEMILHPLSPVS